jgi:FkbM family methyltransferase
MKTTLINYLRSNEFLKSFLDNRRIFGTKYATTYSLRSFLNLKTSQQSTVRVYPHRNIKTPVFARPETSDRSVFEQIFCWNEFGPLLALKNVHYIIDAGANVGYSTLFFLHAFPNATIIAIEPDHDNFQMLQLNTSAFNNRVTCLNSAIWGETCKMVVKQDGYRDNLHWARRTLPASDKRSAGNSLSPEQPHSTTVDGFTIDEVVHRFNLPSVDLLKMDIEGGEISVLQHSHEWLPYVNNILVELHHDTEYGNCELLFENVFSEHFTIEGCGEKRLAQRRQHSS